jgi:hypothetical protein
MARHTGIQSPSVSRFAFQEQNQQMVFNAMSARVNCANPENGKSAVWLPRPGLPRALYRIGAQCR